MRDNAISWLAPVVLCAVVVACGGGTHAVSEMAKVRQTVRRELAAIADGDGATACALATPSGQARLKAAVPGASCPQVVRLVSARLPAVTKQGLRSAQVTALTIRGKTAIVQDADIHASRGSLAGFLQPGSAPTVLTRQPDGSWKISG